MLAAQPGRVREIVPIDLPTPRQLAMRETPEFVALAGASAPRCWRPADGDQAEPVAMAGAVVEDAEAQARFAAPRARSRLAPAAAAAGRGDRLPAVLWWAAGRDLRRQAVHRAVAASRWRDVLYQKFDMLMANLLPTAIEAVCGLPARQPRRDRHRHRVRAPQDRWRRRSSRSPCWSTPSRWWPRRRSWCCCWATAWRRRSPSPRIICFFPTLVNMVRGLRDGAAPQAMELMRVLSATPREVFFKLRVPNVAALPVLGAEDRRLAPR